ncbi:EAL domain-containing protein [Methylomarinum vadi]|uniref:EAL domain-containing protein n=1 Tax=Methylomarinum vadi TaxID=438855 RepID=UPI000689E049|nr:EAL domain-containing protein [Methylomarinum vadi]
MRTFNLRLWIPLLVLISSNLVIAAMILFQTAQLGNNLRQESQAYVQQLMSQLQRRIEEDYSHRNLHNIEQEISAFGTVPEISALSVIDQNGKVEFALRYTWKNRPIEQVYNRFDRNLFNEVVDSKQFHIEYFPEQHTIQAYYPIRLSSNDKHIRTTKYGILYIDYDLSQQFALIWHDTLVESVFLWLLCLVFILFLVHILTKLVTHPVTRLVSVIQQYTKDEKPISSGLTGNGELAVLGRSFDQLTRSLAENHRALIQQKNLYNTLSKTNRLITRVTDQRTLLDETCRIIVEHGGFVLSWISLLEQQREQEDIFASSGPAKEFIQQPQVTLLCASDVIHHRIEEHGFIVINDYQHSPLTRSVHEFAHQFNIAAGAAFAIKRFDCMVAILKIYSDRRNFFNEDIVALLRSMADDISYALNNLRLTEIRQQAENDLREREENLSITLNAIGDAVIATDAQGLITRMNPVAEKLTGWHLDNAKGRPLREVFHIVNTLTRQPAESPVKKVLKRGGIVGLANHTSLIAKNGNEYQIADSAAPITNREGKTIGVILVFQDVSEQYRIEAERKENEQRFRHANEVSGTYVWELDKRLRYTYLTEQVQRVKGYAREQLLGRQPFEFMPEEDAEHCRRIVKDAIAVRGGFTLNHRNITANGEVFWEEVKGQVLMDGNGAAYKILGAGISINERKRAEAEIKQLAYYDPLTNLPNRRMITDRLRHQLPAAKRHHYFGAILFFDLDHFKNLNDSLGHNAGDELLVQIARRLEGLLRAEDTAARLGGDEFVVLLDNIGNNEIDAVDKVRNVTEKIHRNLHNTYFLGGHEYHLSLSIGITLYPQDDLSANELLKQADTALYQAKAQGRNHFQFFRQEMQEAAHQRLQMEKELHAALASNQLQLYYQPQLNAEGGVIGAEALIRWHHPEKGPISPEQFISIAEECGLILKLGRWVLQTAILQMSTWLDNGIMTPRQTLSINISPKQFKQETFVDEVSMIIRQYNLPPGTIILEITENLLLTDINDIIDKMRQLKEIGVDFSIDDFGTGYSSLVYLKRLPLGELKIDKNFVDDINHDVNDRVIIETIIAMAKHMKLQVIAEGVETREQIDFLKMQGCHHYQGYYFSKPLPRSAFESYLTEHPQDELNSG